MTTIDSIRRTLVLAAALTAGAAGCGGSSSSSGNGFDALAARCAAPRAGTGDRQGTLADEKSWVHAWMDQLYLWYQEMPAADAARYATPVDYFKALLTPAVTTTIDPGTGKPKRRDRFSFTEDTASYQQQAQSGVEVGYGIRFVLLARSPPRDLRVAFVEASSPAAALGITRGSRIASIDGAQVVDGDPATLNAGLLPPTPGQPHVFGVIDLGATVPRDVTLTATAATSTPVQLVQTLTAADGSRVGYFHFTDHIATAERLLADAVSTLKAAGVADLVIDLRYNGGGFLYIASQLAYMVAGAPPTSGKAFEQLVFNGRTPGKNPVTGQDLAPTPFYSGTTVGQGLPSLGLPRVFVLTGGGTCSASESVINGLRGVGVQVIQIGATTCGKPYGFYPADNCGTTYFAIQFQGVNAQGFGDYADGFVPGGAGASGLPGCAVADDFAHALGDPAEARLAAALAWRASPGACPPAPAALASGAARAAGEGEGEVVRPRWLQNRIVSR